MEVEKILKKIPRHNHSFSLLTKHISSWNKGSETCLNTCEWDGKIIEN